VLSCEHGGNRIPRPYRSLFRDARALLDSHRGWDIGALAIARMIATDLEAPLCEATVSRLLVDLNRSQGHPALFSERSKRLAQTEREALIARHWQPHRARVEELVKLAADRGMAAHFAIHSFTPVLDGAERQADIGLLYDPTREHEREICRELGRALATSESLRVRMNYPYRGTSDGLTTHLRGMLARERYLGVEIEINQRIAGDRSRHRRLAALLARCIREVLPGASER
jgi:predicted N-formylglutamate amidohydrolase